MSNNSNSSSSKQLKLEKSLICILLNEQHILELYGNSNLYNTACANIFKKINDKYIKDAVVKKFFLAIKSLYVKNIPITFFRVVDILEKNHSLQYDSASKYYYEFEDIKLSSYDEENINFIIQEIINSGHILDVQKMFDDIHLSLKKSDLSAIYAKIENLFRTWNYTNEYDTIELSEVVKSTVKQIEKMKNSKRYCTGISTFDSLDRVTRGFQPGNFIILAARPSFGKTAFAINIAKNAIKNNRFSKNDAVLFFNLEMSKHEIAKRFLSLYSNLDSNKIELAKLNKDEITQLNSAAVQLEKSPIIINESSSLTINKIILISKELSRRKDLKLIVIDYLQLIDVSDNRYMNREQQVAKISRSLKLLANSLNCPIVALSQLSRKTESRENKIPLMSDLRESGSLEQDADVIMFLYRSEYYANNKSTEEKVIGNDEIVDLLISKNRHGPLANIKFHFIKNTSTFEEIRN